MYASGYSASIPGCKSRFHPPLFTSDIVSTPAVRKTSPEPILIAPAALCATCIDDPHRRFVVIPGIVFGRPGRYVAILPRLSPCTPSGYAHPNIRSSISFTSTLVLARISETVAFSMSSGLTCASSPLWALWKGVLT